MVIKVIGGYFHEGEKVKLDIDGKIIERVVKYNKTDGLYIIYKNGKYFEYEVEY